jgi:hypothetical protein
MQPGGYGSYGAMGSTQANPYNVRENMGKQHGDMEGGDIHLLEFGVLILNPGNSNEGSRITACCVCNGPK